MLPTSVMPRRFKNDPGLARDQMDWLIAKKRRSAAADLMIEQSSSAATLGRPEAWADWRRVLVDIPSVRADLADRSAPTCSADLSTRARDEPVTVQCTLQSEDRGDEGADAQDRVRELQMKSRRI